MQISLRTAGALAGLTALLTLAAPMLTPPALAQISGAPAAKPPPAPDPNEPPRRRLDRLEREVNEVRSIVLQARATGHPVEIKEAGPDPEVIAANAKLDDLAATLRSQTGQIETLAHDVAQAKQDAATAQSAAAALADRVDKLEKQLAAQAPPPPPPPPPANGGAAPQADAGAGDSPKTAYEGARQLLLAGDYPGAAAAFQSYLDRYGDQPNATSARYWLGKVKFVQEDYAGAATALIASIRGWPKTSWAPDAVLRLSQSLARLNKPADACATLQELTRRYPHAPADVKSAAATTRKEAQCSR